MKKILERCFELIAWTGPVGSIAGFVILPLYAAEVRGFGPLTLGYLVLAISSGIMLSFVLSLESKLNWLYDLYRALWMHQPFRHVSFYCRPKLFSILAGIVLIVLHQFYPADLRWVVVLLAAINLVLMLTAGACAFWMWLYVHRYGNGYIDYEVRSTRFDGVPVIITDTCRIRELHNEWSDAQFRILIGEVICDMQNQPPRR